MKSLADDLSDAEADDATSGLSSEIVRTTTTSIDTITLNKVSEKCVKLNPIDISGTDTQAGSYRLTKVMDNDPDSWWRMRGEGSGSRHWYAQTEFATPVVVDRYDMAVSTQGRSKNYYPKDWSIEASSDGVSWTIVSTQTGISDWEYEEKRSFWGSNGKCWLLWLLWLLWFFFVVTYCCRCCSTLCR